jgi:hypothetical protein
MPIQTSSQTSSQPIRRIMSFKQFIAKPVADADWMRSRREMLRGRKRSKGKSTFRQAVCTENHIRVY